MKKILICTPCIDSKVTTGYLNTILSLNSIGPDKYQFPIFTLNGNSSIDDARSQMASVFLDSPFDYLFFIDSDVELRAIDVKKILEADKDIIGIPVMKKNYAKPILNIGNILSMPDDGIVEVDGISTSAMLIRRNVLEAFKDCETYTNKEIINNSALNVPTFYTIFHSGLYKGNYTHEDYMFCHDARAKGFRIHALLDARTIHYGTVPFIYENKPFENKPVDSVDAFSSKPILG
jgi:hypothetical protein